MEDVFITDIEIKKLRHLENIHIELSKTERRHLILTGKNGSGKTSLLDALRDYFEFNVINADQKLSNRVIEYLYPNTFNIIVNFIGNGIQLYLPFHSGELIIAYFDSKRLSSLIKPEGLKKIETRETYLPTEHANENFLQYIVNLKADRSFAKDEGNNGKAKEIDLWFENFDTCLKEIFGESFEKLEFDSKNYTFNIIEKGKEKFDFNTLADGFSSIMSIVSELIMRMENKSAKNYNIQGIVFIDEIEAHLHIELQKKILPFLTAFFPKIQFIVSTHSPFVLSSIENAVVYDLEKKMQVEDLSGYSVDAIIESYFDSDKYSTVIKKKLEEYECFLNKKDLTDAEQTEFDDLEDYLKGLPKTLSPELDIKYNQLLLQKHSGK